MRERRGLLARLAPGLLVAATGVGAGDLATAAFTGERLGLAVAWAVIVGAFLKYVLNEGLARWQLATGETLLEGAIGRLPRALRPVFALYLLPWSWFVGAALVSACGVCAQSLVPLGDDPRTGKLVWGAAHSLLGLAIAWRGGYAWLKRVLGLCVGVMFVTVVTSAALVLDDPGALARGLLLPTIPAAGGEGPGWTVALVGGVGGTLTVLCYGYWIREEGRTAPSALGACRLDLAAGYGATALFGVAMIVLGSRVELEEGASSGLVVALADRLAEPLGPAGRLAFLVGAWAAVASSLIGVWQSVPYVFADYWRLLRSGGAHGAAAAIDTRARPYRAYLVGLALAPLLGLALPFVRAQKLYAIVGAFFLPLLAVALLVLNGRRDRLGDELRDRPATRALLLAVALFFVLYGWYDLRS